ncbi:MAG: pyridoxal phosphate-dependent aminotransferase [Saprospiraceae bacterium]|nr:pyridoxal phosphate-dependent aminotransferase [Saprospiraceae bacterium]
MPKLSARVESTFASPFRKFLPLAQQAKARGTQVVHLNIGQPDFLMPPDTLDGIGDLYQKFIPYGEAEGQMPLRQAWCQYYEKFGVTLDTEELIITCGASEGIYFTLMAIADLNDQIIVPEPFYANYNGFCQMAGVEIVPLFSSIDDGFPIPGISAFEEAIGPRTKAILLSNPNNPSGKVYNRQMLLDLVGLVRKHDLYLLVDEAYSEFIYEDFEFIPALSFAGVEKNVVVIDSISKRFNACGVRVGAIASRNTELLQNIAKYSRLRLSPPMLGQTFATRALQLSNTYHQELRKDFAERRAYILHRLDGMEGVLYHAPEGAFYLFVRLPIDDSDRFCAWLLTDFAHDGRTVMLSPGTGFYATPGKGKNEVRIAYILEKPALEIAMDCLEHALNVYPGSTKNTSLSAVSV